MISFLQFSIDTFYRMYLAFFILIFRFSDIEVYFSTLFTFCQIFCFQFQIRTSWTALHPWIPAVLGTSSAHWRLDFSQFFQNTFPKFLGIVIETFVFCLSSFRISLEALVFCLSSLVAGLSCMRTIPNISNSARKLESKIRNCFT